MFMQIWKCNSSRKTLKSLTDIGSNNNGGGGGVVNLNF